MKLIIIFTFTLCLAITSCTSSPYRSFQNVNSGMDKSEVLDLLGSPNKSERYKGLDIWQYSFYEDNKKIKKEVHFRKGKVIYYGKPKMSHQSASDAQKEFKEYKKSLRKARKNKRFKNLKDD